MNQKINGCHVFFPQRIVSVESKDVSGVYLGTKEVSSLTVNLGFDKIIEAQSESKLASNSQENPNLVVFQNHAGMTFVFFDKTKKILFCHSFLDNDNVYIVKNALKKEFSCDSKAEFLDYARTHLGKSLASSEIVQLDIDGKVSLEDSYEHLSNTKAFLNASITPLLRFPHRLSVPISNRGLSMVVLDIKNKFLCIDCISVEDAIRKDISEKKNNKEAPISNGLEGYFNKIKRNN
jgi:hypothetical protein